MIWPLPDLDDSIASLRALVDSGRDATEILGRRFDLGLAWPLHPIGLGGRSWDAEQSRAAEEALAAAEIPNPPASFVGPHLIVPMLVVHGSPAQQELLRPTFTGEARWCQLFSEPGAGSDLANVSTAALRDGDQWLIRGQKVWNSFAAEATHGILLARTDPSLPKHRGMSMFLLDMSRPGVSVRPLRDMTGVAHFNEVFIDDVVVDDRHRLGPANDGWCLAIEVLAYERLAVGRAAADQTAGRPRPIAEYLPYPELLHGATRDRYLRTWIDEKVIGFTEARMISELLVGRPTVDPISMRVMATEHNFEVLDLAMDVLGPSSVLFDPDRPPDDEGSNLQRDYLYARGLMIGGGTLEICRNQIGERVLGLPPEPRVDKDQPWRATTGQIAGDDPGARR